MQEQLAVDARFASLAIKSSVTSVIIRNALIIVTVCRIFYNFILHPPHPHYLNHQPPALGHSLTTRGVPLLDHTKTVYHF